MGRLMRLFFVFWIISDRDCIICKKDFLVFQIKYVNFPSNLRIDAWLKNKNNERNNLSFFDSFLYTFGLNRDLIRNRVFGSSIDILGAKFDRVYLFNYSNYIGWILENLLSNSSKISIIDEGVCSYIVNLYDRDLLRKADEVLLYDPSLVVGEFPEKIKVLQLDATGFSKPQVIDWLKRLFPKVKGVSSRKDEIIWIGQNFGSSEKGARRLKFRNAHVELFRDFVKKYASGNEVIRYRPHPSKLKELDKIAESCGFCEIDISSGNPYEVELLLNYKELPREIHTISSSGALYLYMLLGERSRCVKSYFSFKQFFEMAGSSLDVEVPGFFDLFIKLKEKYPNNLFIERF